MQFHYHLALRLIKNRSSAGCSLFASCILSGFAVISESSGSAWVCTHMYVFWALIPSCPIIHPNTGTKDNVSRHLSTADVISFLKEVRKTLLQKSRSWYSIVVAPQLLSESHLQYCPQMGLTGLEYSWILPVKWQPRNKIKTTHFSPHIFFRATVWGFFRNIKLPQCCGRFFSEVLHKNQNPTAFYLVSSIVVGYLKMPAETLITTAAHIKDFCS